MKPLNAVASDHSHSSLSTSIIQWIHLGCHGIHKKYVWVFCVCVCLFDVCVCVCTCTCVVKVRLCLHKLLILVYFPLE